MKNKKKDTKVSAKEQHECINAIHDMGVLKTIVIPVCDYLRGKTNGCRVIEDPFWDSDLNWFLSELYQIGKQIHGEKTQNNS